MIDASEHATKLLGEDLAYDGVVFDREIGQGLYVIARLRPKREVAESIQPVTLKLRRITKKEEDRKLLAKQIWAGVDDADKKEIIKIMIGELSNKYQSLIDDAPRAAVKYPNIDIKSIVEDARAKLTRLDQIKNALSEGRASIEIEPETASLEISC